MPSADRFDLETYCKLLSVLDDRRTFLRFQDTTDILPERFVLLRHDVDFSMDAALRMAEVEASHGVRSTYFLLPSCRFYNLLDGDIAIAPRLLVEMGHEVGLHYDVAALERHARPAELFAMQADLLSELAGARVRSVAMHNPSVTHGDIPFDAAQFVNAYSSSWSKDILYISDSCAAWRDNAAAILETETFPDRLQLLVHPIWWGNEHRIRWQRLDAVFDAMIERSTGDKSEIVEGWRRHGGVMEHDARAASTGGG